MIDAVCVTVFVSRYIAKGISGFYSNLVIGLFSQQVYTVF